MRTLLSIALCFASTTALAAPTELSQQGRLYDASGAALDGTHDIQFTLYDAAATGNQLWTETHALEFTNGYYHAALGGTTPLDTTVFTGPKAYLALAIDAAPELANRLEVVSVPYAINAEVSTNVSGGVVDASEILVNGTTVINAAGEFVGAATGSGSLGSLTCSAAEVAVWSGSEWACGPNETAHVNDASALTQGVLDINRLPIGSGAGDVAAGDHTHGLSTLTGLITSSQLPSDFDAAVATASGAVGNGNPLHHNRYGDAEAVAAMGANGVANALNHDAYTDASAVTAMGAADEANPLNHDAFTAADVVSTMRSNTWERLSGRYIQLYGHEITINDNNAAQANPHLNITATRGNHIGSVSFELVGSNHCGYCYSAGPKAVIWNNGNVPFTFYTDGGYLYVEMDATNSITIQSSAAISPVVISEIPSGATVVERMN